MPDEGASASTGPINLSPEQRRTFEQRGVLRIAAAIDAGALLAARDHVRARLERAGLTRAGQWIAPPGPATAKVLKKALHGCSGARPFRDLTTPDLVHGARVLAGDDPVVMPPGSQLLFTPPNAAQWRIPHNVWHVDLPRLGEKAPPGVQAFGFLDRVEHGGGGTLLVAGSHRLLNDAGRVGSKALKYRLARLPYFRDLFDRGFARGELEQRVDRVDGVELEVVELTGVPGDVCFADMRTLHSLGPNARREPRMMVTQRWLAARVAARLSDLFGERLAASQPG